MSSVDDPEKHFLGNLLEDDAVGGDSGATSSGSSSSNGSSSSSSSSGQPVNWSDPPPPYSPRDAAWDVSTSTSSIPGWYPFSRERQEPFDLLASFATPPASASASASTSSTPPPQVSTSSPYQLQYHLHHHTHNVQVQNHYFPAPPPGLEAYGPPRSSSSFEPTLSSSPVFDYSGLAPIKTSSNHVLFSAWKKENMSQTSPQPPSSVSPSSTSLRSFGSPSEDDVRTPLSTKEVIELAKERKNLSKSYAEHLIKSTPKRGTIGAEKKHKQELAKMNSQTMSESSRIEIKEQPHSAPVLSKMPFSYRDVAARVDSSVSNSINSSEERKDALSSKSNDSKAAQAKSSDSSNSKHSDGFKKNESRKSRADNEFQKISKSKKVSKSSSATAPIVYESVHPVDASSRYDVLQDLENLPAQRNGKKNPRAPLIQEVFSRSGSPVDDLEDTGDEENQRARSTSNHSQSMKKEQKKRAAPVAQTRRRKSRKSEPTWMDNAISGGVDYAVLAWSYIVHMFQWTFELIVDVCVKIYDVFLCSFESFCAGTWKAIRKIFLTVVFCFCVVVCYCKNSASIYGWLQDRCVKRSEEEEEWIRWGCRRELPLPSTMLEYAERVSGETNRDAYTVFGLPSDCSDDDIKRNYKRLVALVCPDKCGYEGADDVFYLLNTAFNAIGAPETRVEYTRENASSNELHQEVLKAWDVMRGNYEKNKHSLVCDCHTPHFRVPTDIVPTQARYCKRCGVNHPAKQNDIWVEKRHLGLTTVYLTCTDNVVYDITDWATCEIQRPMLKNMRAHTHNVQYRLLTPLTVDFANPPPYLNAALGYPSSSTDARFLSELQEEYSSLLRQRNLSQISFKTCEPREEDRSRRAANRRQKRWR